MGKIEQQNQYQSPDLEAGNRGASSGFFCRRCPMGFSKITNQFSCRCVVVLILGFAVLLSGIFWILPFRSLNSGFEAKEKIKNSATVQAYFRLQKPVSELILHMERLEYDIYEEIGVPYSKVAMISMHQSGASNWSSVVFGVLSDPSNSPLNPVSLSVLRSSLIELFLLRSNLTLTTSIFGQPSIFEILKFPGGLTLIPPQTTSIWQTPQVLFNFTLHNTIAEIKDNLDQLKNQLKSGLHLRPDENVFVQITNKAGSTMSPPVTVQASVMSDWGILLPQRLKQLAQAITDSPTENLGLNNSMFGKVKSVTLSTYLTDTLHATPPIPSPAPLPEPPISPYPALSPSYSPASSPGSGPYHSFPPSPVPSIIASHPPSPCPYHHPVTPPISSPVFHSSPAPHEPPKGPPSQFDSDLSPSPEVSYGSSPGPDNGGSKVPVSSSLAPLSPSSAAVAPLYKDTWLVGVSGLLTFYLICRSHR